MNYEQTLKVVFNHGAKETDRTDTLSMLGMQMRFDLTRGFPLVTTKQVYIQPMVEELLWMLSGSTDNSVLRNKNAHIWDDWAGTSGDLGPIYGHQWRSWETRDGGSIDQIADVVRSIRLNPDSRRRVVSAWNVADIPDMALPPCHALFQFYVNSGKLSCQLYQRSADMFLGVPFNIASYALLTHMVAQQVGLGVGKFIWTGGDCRIYSNHFEQVKEQLSRERLPAPKLMLNKAVDISSYKLSDVVFEGYQHHPAIEGKVAV